MMYMHIVKCSVHVYIYIYLYNNVIIFFDMDVTYTILHGDVVFFPCAAVGPW